MISQRVSKIRSNTKIHEKALNIIAAKRKHESLKYINEVAKNKKTARVAMKKLRKGSKGDDKKTAEELLNTNSNFDITNVDFDTKSKIQIYKDNDNRAKKVKFDKTV